MQPAAPPPANSGTSTPAGATKEGAPAQSQTPAAPTNPAGDTPKPEAKPAQANSEPPKPTPTPPRPGPVTGTSFRWETAGLADGPYLLKVVASDVRSNPGDARTAERVVGPVLVTNAKPKLTLDSATSPATPRAGVAARPRGRPARADCQHLLPGGWGRVAGRHASRRHARLSHGGVLADHGSSLPASTGSRWRQ